MTQSAKILRVHGQVEDFMFKGAHPTVREMQDVVGGYASSIRLLAIVKWFHEPAVMIENREGFIMRLHVNLEASTLAQRHIVGDVIIMPERLLTARL